MSVVNISDLINHYYKAFNERNYAELLQLLHPSVEHDINQGSREVGKDKFAQFLSYMDEHYKESIQDLLVLGDNSLHRAAATFFVDGVYCKTDSTFPEAYGQHYTIPAGAFFDFENGLIKKVTTYYNVPEWKAAISKELTAQPIKTLDGTCTIKCVSGSDIAPFFNDLAALRIQVFKEYPYLYEGSLEYEKEYLERYIQSNMSLVILVFDGSRLVGASTCIPMSYEMQKIQKPFLDAHYDLGSICYFGESIILPEYRRRGIGGQFFDIREAHARSLGLKLCAFCEVIRPGNDSRKPPEYFSKESFWHKRGYEKRPDLIAELEWLEISSKEESPHQMVFWTKRLD